MKDELRKRKAADAAMSVAPPQAGSALASSWIGPKRSVVNSTFVADRWSDSNIKKFDFTTYWLSPGSKDATFVFTVALNF